MQPLTDAELKTLRRQQEYRHKCYVAEGYKFPWHQTTIDRLLATISARAEAAELALKAAVEEAECEAADDAKSIAMLIDDVVNMKARAEATDRERDALREALKLNVCELGYCADQLAAKGFVGHPGDSVSRALETGRALLSARLVAPGDEGWGGC
jgi:glutaminase